MDTTMMNDKKYYDKDDFASRGVGNTALGLSIGALGLEVLRNGGLGNILNMNPQNQEESSFGLYKGYRDADDAIIAKNNQDSFALYKGQRDNFDAVMKEITDIKTKLAVAEASQPWKDKSIYDAIALERERRECADNKIVNYANSTFVPHYIAEMTVGTGTTQSAVYNPLCTCGC